VAGIRDNNGMGEREFSHLERTLGKLDDIVYLSDDKKQFIEEMCQKVIKHGRHVRFTIKQATRIAKLKEKYL
jgi:hypothetical protein